MTIQRKAIQYNIIRDNAKHIYGIMKQHITIQDNVIQSYTRQDKARQYNTIQDNTMQ